MAKTKRVLIVGGGKTGSALASRLLQAGCEVRVMDNRPPVFARLVEELPQDVAVLSDGTDPMSLEQVGIATMDVVAAVTGKDEANLVVASLAKFEYQVDRVIVRVNNPQNAWLCTPEMGVDAALNQSDLIATMIVEEISVSHMQTLLRLKQGAVSIVEETITPVSKAAGITLAALSLPEDCNLTAILRGGDVIIPNGTTVLQGGDTVVAVVRSELRETLADVLK